MKRFILSSLVACSIVFAAGSMSVEDKSCVENLENEVVKIVNSKSDGVEQQKAIEILKTKVKIDSHETCETEFQEEIKRLVFGKQKIVSPELLPSEVIEKHAKKIKENAATSNINAQGCIESFESEVMQIINSNSDNFDKEKTKRIMHEIMHERVKASCESAFEEEVKKIVNSKEKY